MLRSPSYLLGRLGLGAARGLRYRAVNPTDGGRRGGRRRGGGLPVGVVSDLRNLYGGHLEERLFGDRVPLRCRQLVGGPGGPVRGVASCLVGVAGVGRRRARPEV